MPIDPACSGGTRRIIGMTEKPRTFDKAILVTNRTEHHSHQAMLTGLHEGLLSLGIDSRLFLVNMDGSDLGGFMESVAAAAASSPESTFLMDINGRMRLPAARALKKFSFMIDHPYAHLTRIANLSPSDIISYVDRSHLNMLKALGVGRGAVFLPHGGPAVRANPKPMKERRIDLLFIGRLEHSPRRKDLAEGLAANTPQVRDIVIETAEEAAKGKPLFDVFCAACKRHSVDFREFGSEGLETALRTAHHWAEARGRYRLLKSLGANLGGRQVHIVGEVNRDFLDTVPDGFTFLGERPFNECLDLMANSKILLNSVTVFPEGGHERICYGMAAGAVVATDPSTFVGEDFTDGENILFWPSDPADSALMVAGALADSGRLDEMAAAAAAIYAAKHTWVSRAAIIDRALNGAPIT